jgi:hypothetical protein
MLTQYLLQTRRLLNDNAAQQQYTDTDLTAYINEGRFQIAAEGQCVRFLTPSSGAVASFTVTSGGSGYVAPVVTVGAPNAVNPGVQATATAVLSGTAINSITVTNGGQGYFTPPSVTITDSVGTGATATAVLSYVNQTVFAQEVYNFSSVQFVSLTGAAVPGIQEVIAVKTVGLIWGTFRYVTMKRSFSLYQSWARNYTSNYYYIPAIACQYGQGAGGSLYMYPIADQAYPMEWDCLCTPIALAADSDPEAIPDPWTNCVQYYAAWKAVMGRGRFEDAKFFWAEYDKFMKRSRGQSSPGAMVNPYGRG